LTATPRRLDYPRTPHRGDVEGAVRSAAGSSETRGRQRPARTPRLSRAIALLLVVGAGALLGIGADRWTRGRAATPAGRAGDPGSTTAALRRAGAPPPSWETTRGEGDPIEGAAPVAAGLAAEGAALAAGEGAGPSASSAGLADARRPSRPARGALSIAGRVLDQGGAPVGGLAVRLVAQAGGDPGSVPGAPAQAARSGGDGSFAFHGLPDDAYELRSEPALGYAAARTAARAGVDSALLVVRKQVERTLVVRGVVVGRDRRPLAGVEVLPIGHKTRGETDGAGRYQVTLARRDPAVNPSLRFARRGHREQRVALDARRLAAQDAVQLDVVMEPAAGETRVAGVVRNRAGEPVPGATVHLISAQRRRTLRAGSGLDGAFLFASVEPAADYRLWVRARQGYRDHLQDNLAVSGDGLDLPVVLSPLERGSLAGRLIDPEGRPVPGFSLELRSAQPGAITRVTGDHQGAFAVDDLPAGRLSLESGSAAPQLSVSGLEITAGARRTVDVVLDLGGHEIAGRVRDGGGRPVAGAQVSLAWRHAAAGMVSQSHRRAITDHQGNFVFTRLGSGPHALTVNAAGFHNLSQEVAAAPPGTAPLALGLQEKPR
jgi:hypothetical protein